MTDQDDANQGKKNLLKREIERIKRLREDVLLLRFHLARRTDITELISDTDRLISEEALKSSLEILEWQETGKRPVFIKDGDEDEETPTTDYVAAAAASLMYSVDVLVNAARMAQEKDATGEPPFPVTPESLRSSLPKADVDAALGIEVGKNKKRETASEAKTYIHSMTWRTFVVFAFTLTIQIVVIYFSSFEKNLNPGVILPYGGGINLSKDVVIPVTAFFWATLGSLVWILIRFRRFGAAYAFDPAHAEIFEARVYSGAITTAVLLYFVFGGKEPWAKNWRTDLPLWAFVLGYAGRLQVELLRIMVERVEKAFTTFFSPPTMKKKKDEAKEK
jgi:hypothetical protein